MENTSLTSEQKAAIREAAISMSKDPDIIERAVERDLEYQHYGGPVIADELVPFDEELHKRAFEQKKRPLTEERKQWKKKLHKLMKA